MDLSAFAKEHVAQITATVGLVTYSLARHKLTLDGVVAGIFVAGVHMIHPWPAFFWLLIIFFFLGTVVTKIGHAAKTHLTQASTGGSGGEGARSSAQVFANSGFASILIAIHAYLLSSTPFISSHMPITPGIHSPALLKLLPVGIIAQYAAVAADTFSSELGILSKTQPFMITAPWRAVPRGTNGGVTVDGLIYGYIGSVLLTGVSYLALSAAPPYISLDLRTALLLSLAGLFGSVIDSILGALLQVTVTDKGTGKVIEGPGGQRVKVAAGGSREQLGQDLLTNNGVNFAMAMLASLLGMFLAWSKGLQISP